MSVVEDSFGHPLKAEEKATMILAGGIAAQGYQCGMLWGAALSEENFAVPSPPVSCATMVAKKMGASKMHAVMAAGLAGGIGLSGGACGALGAAIWIQAMSRTEETVGFNISASWIEKIIKRFIESSDYVFECSEIVGRKFENIQDHAEFICKGGCSRIIDMLAVQ